MFTNGITDYLALQDSSWAQPWVQNHEISVLNHLGIYVHHHSEFLLRVVSFVMCSCLFYHVTVKMC